VSPPFQLLVAIALPIAAVYSLIGGGRLVSWIAEQQTRAPAAEPIERVRANLVRLRALRAAYVDALCGACDRLGVSPPADAQAHPESVRQSEIYRTEAALRERGLDVRETAGR